MENQDSQRCLAAIGAAVDRLHFLAKAIRKASVRTSDQRLFEFTDDDDKNFYNTVVSYIRLKFPDSRPSLREHLSDTIVKRRRALLDKERHGRKLQTRRSSTKQTHQPQVPTTGVESEVAAPPLRLQAPLPSTIVSKVTQASKMDGIAAMKRITQKHSLSIASSNRSRNDDGTLIGYPDPPRFKKGDRSVPCPYCLEPLQTAKLSNIAEGGRIENKFWV